MKYIISVVLNSLLILFVSQPSVGQNLSFNPKKCNVLTSCNPFVNGFACVDAVLRTTHGSPSFYSKDSSIQLNAALTSNGTIIGEGFTLAYHFKPNIKYTIKIGHKGVPQTGSVIYPNLLAALTNDPPRFNDGCSLNYLTAINVISQYAFGISSTATISSFDIQPTEDISFLWLRSSPIQAAEAGLLISSIEIRDYSVPPPPPPPPPPTSPPTTCEMDYFCAENRGWRGSISFRASDPIHLSCDAFRTAIDPGPDYYRIFISTEILLQPGFIASGYDYHSVNPYLRITANANPCQALRIAFADTVTPIKSKKIDENLPDNITIYPSPSKGLVKIACSKSELLHAAVTVLDQSGRIVFKMNNSNNGNLIDLDLQHLSNGIYFIRINAPNKVVVKKLLISR